MPAPELYAVILAGGSGTRFWPASRRSRPKQYLKVGGPATLLGETWQRLEGLVPPERALVVTTAEQADHVRRALPELPAENLLLEPVARNTAPCVALATFEVERRNRDSIQIVLPADHVIRPREAFRRTVAAAAEEANGLGSLIVFGIRPTHPATGFGYIEAGEVRREVDGIPVHRVERFVEKPDAGRARAFLERGGFFWNAGIFVWHTEAIRRAIADFMPEEYAALSKARRAAELEREYPALPARSIDVAVLERAPNVRMLPIDYFWSDVGAWDALASVLEADGEGNVTGGGATVVAEDATNCIVHGPAGELVALLGVEDVIVVRSGDATLVCRRDRAQEVKDLVERVRREGEEFL